MSDFDEGYAKGVRAGIAIAIERLRPELTDAERSIERLRTHHLPTRGEERLAKVLRQVIDCLERNA